MRIRRFLGCALLALTALHARAEEPADLQPKIDEAIRKGAAFLAAQYESAHGAGDTRTRELVLLALLHGGCDPQKSPLKQGIEDLLHSPLTSTYNVGLTAVALLTLDRTRYQARIEQCAQWLVDAQCVNGQWTYGDFQVPTPGTTPPTPPVTTGAADTFADRKIVRRHAARVALGDNSNTQFAVLGLWAAQLSRIAIPEATWKSVQDLYLKSQNATGGWSYGALRAESPYLSMTCAGTAALSICARVMKTSNRLEDAIRAGQYWIGNNFDVKNPRLAGIDTRYYYALYSIERAGVLLGLEKFGVHGWYREGALEILAAQKLDGSWSEEVTDTSFAILFLKRATRSITEAAGEGERGTVRTPDDELGEK